MESLTSAINVQVDAKDKELATSILKNLGLNMSTAINIYLKQIINNGGLPFEVKNPKPTRELKKALKEGEKIIKDLESGKRKGYTNMEDFIKSLNEDLK